MEKELGQMKEKGGDQALMISEEDLRDRCAHLARVLIVQFGKAGHDDLLDASRLESIINDLTKVTKDFILEFPDYNSHRGVKEMINNPIYKERLVGTIQRSMGFEFD